MNFSNKLFSILISVLLITTPISGLELDLSVDEDIRKNYNPSKLENESLPPLPNTPSKTGATKPPKVLPSSQKTGALTNSIQKNSTKKVGNIKLKNGTKFLVRSNQPISSSTRAGTRISFSSISNVYLKNGILVPAGTIFRGEIINSHNPQITGNGGLIVMFVDGITYNGSTSRIEAKITKANHKKIFINNIKGERGYLKGIANSIKPGRKFYKKMMSWTNNLKNWGPLVILTPFTVIPGVLVYGINIVGSPIFAIFSKGSAIYLPAGTEYQIKILEDSFI